MGDELGLEPTNSTEDIGEKDPMTHGKEKHGGPLDQAQSVHVPGKIASSCQIFIPYVNPKAVIYDKDRWLRYKENLKRKLKRDRDNGDLDDDHEFETLYLCPKTCRPFWHPSEDKDKEKWLENEVDPWFQEKLTEITKTKK